MPKKSKKKVNNKHPIADRIKDLTEITMPMVTVLHGRAGSGKTTVAGSFPKPILFLDVKDKGTESAKTEDLVEGEILVLEVHSIQDIWDMLDYILDNPHLYKTVVIDHLTALQKFSNKKIKEDMKRTTMTQQMFGMSSTEMQEIIDAYKEELTAIDIEPVFIVQSKLTKGDSEAGDSEEELIPEVGPALMPSVATHLGAAARIIGHAYLYETTSKSGKENIEYRLRLGPNPYYLTKVTRPKGYYCPQYIVDCTYTDIKNIVDGKYKAPKKKRTKKKKKK